ncbi:hypothetical protein [Candidatus Tisiphia endosymbiont of Myopa tessellatipennis]
MRTSSNLTDNEWFGGLITAFIPFFLKCQLIAKTGNNEVLIVERS